MPASSLTSAEACPRGKGILTFSSHGQKGDEEISDDKRV